MLRVVPADVLASRTGEGRWQAVLSVDGTDVQRWLPALASAEAYASPRPCPLPVTIATFPVMSMALPG